MWKRLCLLLSAVAAAFVVTGAGHHRPMTSGPEYRAAAQAVASLTGGGADVVPTDFADVMGYQPTAITTEGGDSLIKPSGACSGPGPDHLWAPFERACQTHDFGYDLLRYAALTGGELGPWARRAIDDQFSAAVHRSCEESGKVGCAALATTASAAVDINSWRQGNGVPISEDGTPYAAAAAMIFLALAGPPLADTARRRLSNSALLIEPAVTLR